MVKTARCNTAVHTVAMPISSPFHPLSDIDNLPTLYQLSLANYNHRQLPYSRGARHQWKASASWSIFTNRKMSKIIEEA